MLIISDSDEEVLLRTRRMLYAAGIMTITLPYTELLTVKYDETVYGLILVDPSTVICRKVSFIRFAGEIQSFP